MSNKEKLSEFYKGVIDDIRESEKDNNFVLYCLDRNSESMLDEWDLDRNNGLMPRDVTYASNKKVHWKCEKGHTWEVSLCNRTKYLSKCPYCMNRKAWPGYNDLMTTHPDIVKEWNYEKNQELKPNNILAGSNKVVWWKCEHGHEWKATPNSRVLKDTGCPYCTNKKVLEGYNDLKTTHPKIANEWNYKRNKNIGPTDVVAGSNKMIWWKCEHDHEWKATVNSRVFKDTNCPTCLNKQVLEGYNDLKTTHPKVVNEWNYEKNKSVGPAEVVAGSHRKVWWKCKHGHEWKSGINDRTLKKADCPYCTNRKFLEGYNDLASNYPELLKEWDYEKNGDLTPTKVMYGSGGKVWWKCEHGHSWKAMIANRSTGGTSCPLCCGNKMNKK